MNWSKVGNLKGPPGKDGSNGTNGTNGTNGQRGSQITFGTGAPANTTGMLPGDVYIDTAAGDVYQFSA